MRVVVMLIIVIAVVAAIHSYLWHRLVALTTRRGRVRRAGTIIVVFLALLPFVALFSTRAAGLPRGLRDALSWVGYLWLGTMFYLLLALLIAEPIRLALRRWTRPTPKASNQIPDHTPNVATGQPPSAPAATGEPAQSSELATTQSGSQSPEQQTERETSAPDQPAHDPSRRLVLARGLALGAGVAAASTVGYGIKTAFDKPRIEHVPITLNKLDPALDGYRIGLVSDIHLGPFVRRARAESIVAHLNRLDVGTVSIVGDLVDGDVDELGRYAEPLGELEARDGTYFVTGNHEYYSGVDQWLEFLPSIGVKVLQNQRITIQHGNASFDLAGVNDMAAEEVDYQGPDIPGTLKGRDTSRPVVLMSHQPVTFDDAVANNVDLQLSGHTHGGQLWPFHYLVRAQQGIVSGYKRTENSQLYVTRGVGFWGPPMRVGSAPEITVIELRAAGS